jgi:hypothetical protein
MKEKFLKPENKEHMDAVTFYNLYKLDDAINLFNSCHRKNRDGKSLVIENGKTKNNEVVIENDLFITTEHEMLKLPPHETLTPFQVFLVLQANKNVLAAIMEIERKYMNRDIPFIRVGVDYYKVISKPDRYSISRQELKRWTKSELITDYGKKICELIPKYDDFTIEPSNLNYEPVIVTQNNVFRNLYSKFDHEPKYGDWKWSKILMEHVFGEQYEQGLKYMQWLYLNPKQILPILVLASKERKTGKTTFINWINQIFGANATIINPSDLTSDFNGSYSTSNIIAIEETMIDKSTSIEKLKSITTAKYISVNKKHIDHYKIPFFGKVIIATNNVINFARIDDEEIRFWIRLIPDVKYENLNIEDDLVKEIPAFLHHLKTLPPPVSHSRMGFLPDEIDNDILHEVKKESKPTLFKEILLKIIDYFDKDDALELYMTLSDIKEYWFLNNHQYNTAYIKRILVDHFKFPENITPSYYIPINSAEKKRGRVYVFKREMFENIEWKNEELDNGTLPF